MSWLIFNCQRWDATSYNTLFVTYSVRPNAFGTSQTAETLGAISRQLKEKKQCGKSGDAIAGKMTHHSRGPRSRFVGPDSSGFASLQYRDATFSELFLDECSSGDGAEEFAVGGDFAAGDSCAVSQCERLFVI